MPSAASRARAAIATALAFTTLPVGAYAASIYSSSATFFNAIGPRVTDDYQNPAYQQPENLNGTFTDAGMSAIFGETKYQTTGFANHNFVEYQSGDGFYCGGCNGSFRLDFTETSVGNQNGIYGVGFHIVNNQLLLPYVAYVTYADNTVENFALPVIYFQAPTPLTTFWGITSNKRIKSIRLGGSGGASVRAGGFAIDNLTIGGYTTNDFDADGVPDANDNCMDVPNGPLIPDAGGASQRDANGDGYGNICDPDLNNTGLVTATDYIILRNALNTANAVADLNGSGLVTSADYIILRNMLNRPPGPSGLHP